MVQQDYSQEDKFVATVLRTWAWAQRNTRTLVVGIVAAAIIVFGVRYYVDYQARVREAASAQIRAIRFDSQTSNAAATVDRLQAFLIQFGSTPYSREARVLLAHALLLQNRAAEAIEPARQAADKVGSEPLSNRAAFLLAAAYEEVADTSAAIAAYEQVGLHSQLRLEKSQGLEGAARLRAAQGDHAGAAALYDQLIELFSESAQGRAFYELRAAEERAQALVTSQATLAEGG
ncbi:MAG: tetratricopeptide repeat protein [Gemmatimonadota bacterium]|nr:MAG: tetratricopeptide repeat protein [Gemmatimonadota bacterium]